MRVGIMDTVEISISDSNGKSKFVTVLAWIFIVLTGFGLFILILQNIMITMMFPVDEMQKVFNRPEAAARIPALARFMASHFRLFFLGFLFVTAGTFISSIGLLKRKNWARIFFIVILVLGIICNLSGIFLQGAMMPKIPQVPEHPGMPDFQSMFIIMRVFSAVMAIGMSVLFGWIIKKLVSKDIKREFITV
jgi:hypothetical protein